MIEADLFCVFGLLYSAAVCLVSTLIFRWLDLKPGWDGVGDFLVIAWIGVAMSGLAWMKVWMVSPQALTMNATERKLLRKTRHLIQVHHFLRSGYPIL